MIQTAKARQSVTKEITMWVRWVELAAYEDDGFEFQGAN